MIDHKLKRAKKIDLYSISTLRLRNQAMGRRRRHPFYYEESTQGVYSMPTSPLFSYSIEPSSDGLLADNKVVKVSTLLGLFLDLADDGAKVLDVLFDLHS
jgi:hypothetical protein